MSPGVDKLCFSPGRMEVIELRVCRHNTIMARAASQLKNGSRFFAGGPHGAVLRRLSGSALARRMGAKAGKTTTDGGLRHAKLFSDAPLAPTLIHQLHEADSIDVVRFGHVGIVRLAPFSPTPNGSQPCDVFHTLPGVGGQLGRDGENGGCPGVPRKGRPR